MNFSTYIYTDKGSRKKNEDYASYLYEKWRFGVWAVADGLGGHDAGEIASQVAVETVVCEFKKSSLLNSSMIFEICSAANKNVIVQQGRDHGFYSMKTTLAAMFYRRGRVMFAHVGDSRIYVFRKSKIIFQTQDHSIAQLQAAQGRMNPDDIRFHSDRNQLLRALGSPTGKPDVTSVPMKIRRGDAMLLCTDGFWENVLEQCMQDTLSISKTPEQWVDLMLYHHAKVKTERQDNYTVAAVFAY